MNSIIGLVIASLLVAAIVAVAIPNIVQADSPVRWCVEGTTDCFVKKADCKDAANGDISRCIKATLK